MDGKTIEEIVEHRAGRGDDHRSCRRRCARTATSSRPCGWSRFPSRKAGRDRSGIATVEDRVVQTAMKLVLEPIFEADFHDCSYGYRPKRDAKQASLAIREDLYNHAWGVVEIDFKSYFTSIPHGKLMKLITKRIADGSMLKLIKQTLKVGVWDKGQVVPTKVGVPQGSPISPLYSNIYLNLLDQLWHSRGYPAKLGATLHRYADDAHPGLPQECPQPALAAFEAIAKRMDLTLNRDKTRETRLTEGFDFLGVQFRQTQKSHEREEHHLPLPGQVCPTDDSEQAEIPHLATRADQSAGIRGDGESDVTGWVNYFRHTNASQAFRGLQRFVNIRFRRYLTQTK